jgi:hypothetical protein
MNVPRPPAPGPLGVIQGFCNSACLLRGEDSLRDVDGARAWLLKRSLLDAREIDYPLDLSRLVGFRETLRDYLEDTGQPDKSTVARLNAVATQTRTSVRWTDGGQPTVIGDDVSAGNRIIGNLLGHVVLTRADGSLRRLKLCRAANCRWVFYDRSPNLSGSWCTMAICGSRHKMSTYRARARRQDADGGR